jgi:hypothetical protein
VKAATTATAEDDNVADAKNIGTQINAMALIREESAVCSKANGLLALVQQTDKVVGRS